MDCAFRFHTAEVQGIGDAGMHDALRQHPADRRHIHRDGGKILCQQKVRDDYNDCCGDKPGDGRFIDIFRLHLLIQNDDRGIQCSAQSEKEMIHVYDKSQPPAKPEA